MSLGIVLVKACSDLLPYGGIPLYLTLSLPLSVTKVGLQLANPNKDVY